MLLFAVAAVGVPLGRIRVVGVRVGVEAVLFAGPAFGALDLRLRLPEIVVQLGLALSSSTWSAWRAGARSYARSTLVALVAGAAATVVVARLLGVDGATTNTPALAGVVEALRGVDATGGDVARPVVAYSPAYPGGVLGVIVAIAVLQRLWRIDYGTETAGLRDYGVAGEHLERAVVRVTRADLRLEFGDHVRVIARRDQMPAIEQLLGDSYQGLSEVDVPSLAVGLGAGLLLGLVALPLPGGVTLQLGFAGGPLLVALALGAIGRTGRWVWTLPYSANLTLRQFGLLLFLAGVGVGTGSGYAFAQTLRAGDGWGVVLAGAALTLALAATTLAVGHKLLRVPMSLMIAVVCGQHKQPAALGYAVEQAGSDLPHVGYAMVFPLATAAKIVLAQLVLRLVG